MIEILHKDQCCGCGACVAVCGHSAISYKRDEEGFMYPNTNLEKCVDCGLCDKVCPFLNGGGESMLSSTTPYALKNKNRNIQLLSASGGIFSELATNIISRGGFVVGALFNKSGGVFHGLIHNTEDIPKMRRSKYVQSFIDKSLYVQIREKLREKETVLFTGTPCQCLALRNFLRKPYDNLYIVDIVCHGVPSPMIWNLYLDDLCNAYGKKREDIIDIQFKYKDGVKYFWKHPGFKILWKDGTEYLDYSNHTCFENGFLSNLFVRPSCHHCKIKNLTSKSDISIGDFWGVEFQKPNFFDNNGVSIALLNTDKGKEIFEKIKERFYIEKISIEDAIKYNKRICESSPVNKNRKKFFKQLNENNLDELVSKLSRTKQSPLRKVIRKGKTVILSIYERKIKEMFIT